MALALCCYLLTLLVFLQKLHECKRNFFFETFGFSFCTHDYRAIKKRLWGYNNNNKKFHHRGTRCRLMSLFIEFLVLFPSCHNFSFHSPLLSLSLYAHKFSDFISQLKFMYAYKKSAKPNSEERKIYIMNRKVYWSWECDAITLKRVCTIKDFSH